MTPYLFLIMIYILKAIACIGLVLSLHPYKDEYIAKRIVIIPIAMSFQAISRAFNLFLFVAPSSVSDNALNIASVSEIPSIVVAGYLAGLFMGWWNGLGRKN